MWTHLAGNKLDGISYAFYDERWTRKDIYMTTMVSLKLLDESKKWGVDELVVRLGNNSFLEDLRACLYWLILSPFKYF